MTKPEPKRRRSAQLAKLAKRGKLDAQATQATVETPEAPELMGAPEAEHLLYRFGRHVRLLAAPNAEQSPLIFIKNAPPGFAYVGIRVPIGTIAPVHKPRPRRAAASPLSARQPALALPTAVSPASPVQVQVQAVAQDEGGLGGAQFLRVVVLTELDERECMSAALEADATERSFLFRKIAKLLKLLDPIARAPIALVASAEALRSIGQACPSLRTGSFQHIQVRRGLDPLDIDATAALLTAQVRATPCLNPPGKEDLSVRLAFVYTGDFDHTNLEQQIVMPESVRVGGGYVYPYAMVNYKYLKADSEAVELTLSAMSRSDAYINYTSPCAPALALALALSSAPAGQPGPVAPVAPHQLVIWLAEDSE